MQGTYRADNGDLVVPFDKSTIETSPYKDTGVAPTRREAEDLARHYELGTLGPNPPTSCHLPPTHPRGRGEPAHQGRVRPAPRVRQSAGCRWPPSRAD